jgi:hypothetical protein
MEKIESTFNTKDILEKRERHDTIPKNDFKKQDLSLKIGTKIKVDGETYTVIEGPTQDISGVSYILQNKSNSYYDIEFIDPEYDPIKANIILAKAIKKGEGSWEFKDHKEVKKVKIMTNTKSHKSEQ